MTATATSVTALYADIEFGQAMTVLTSCGIRERDARVVLVTAHRVGIASVVTRDFASGWSIEPRAGGKFTMEQESFFMTVPAGTAERNAQERASRAALLAAGPSRGCAGCDDREGYGFPAALHSHGCRAGG